MGKSAHARKNLKRVLSVILLILVTLCFWPLTTAHADAADAGPAAGQQKQLKIKSSIAADYTLYKIVGMDKDGQPLLTDPSTGETLNLFGQDGKPIDQATADKLYKYAGNGDKTAKVPSSEEARAFAKELESTKGGAQDAGKVSILANETKEMPLTTEDPNGYYLLTGTPTDKSSKAIMDPIIISLPSKIGVDTNGDWSGLLTIDANKWTTPTPYNPSSDSHKYKIVKSWTNASPEDITGTISVRLLVNGKDCGIKQLSSPNWSAEWNIPQDSSNDFTVEELSWSVKGTVVDKNSYDISNTQPVKDKKTGVYIINLNNKLKENPKTSVSGTKTWDDENDKAKKRPSSITVNLLANGEKADSRKVSDADNWTYKFDNLPTKDSKGNTIKYTVSEDPVTDYTATISGYDINNKYTPPANPDDDKTNVPIKGQKIWEDADTGQQGMPDWIKLRLLLNGEDAKTVTVKPDGNLQWNFDFGNLPTKDKDGNTIKYDIVEQLPEGYQFTTEGTNVINKYTVDRVQIPVNKVWKGDDSDTSGRQTVKIHLYKNGVDTSRVLELNAGNRWQGSFTDLPKMKDGKPCEYTIKEEPVAGYGASIQTIQDNGTTPSYTVTNTKGKPDEPGTTVEYPPTDDDNGDTPNTPTKQNKTVKAVKTGDTTVLMPAVAVLIVSGVLLAILGATLRRRNKAE